MARINCDPMMMMTSCLTTYYYVRDSGVLGKVVCIVRVPPLDEIKVKLCVVLEDHKPVIEVKPLIHNNNNSTSGTYLLLSVAAAYIQML